MSAMPHVTVTVPVLIRADVEIRVPVIYLVRRGKILVEHIWDLRDELDE